MRSLRPPLFFRVQDRVRRQLRLWPEARTTEALRVLLAAEINAKRTGLPADAICRDALLRLARLVAAAGRRG